MLEVRYRAQDRCQEWIILDFEVGKTQVKAAEIFRTGCDEVWNIVGKVVPAANAQSANCITSSRAEGRRSIDILQYEAKVFKTAAGHAKFQPSCAPEDHRWCRYNELAHIAQGAAGLEQGGQARYGIRRSE